MPSHHSFAWVAAQALRADGHRIATEVGLPGGRVDLVCLNAANEWVELYEVKVRAPEAGIAQLVRYRALAEAPDAKLTLIVPPELDTTELRAEAEASGVRVWAFPGWVQPGLFSGDYWGRWVHLPYIHPESTERVRQNNIAWAARRRAERAEGVAA